MTRWALFADCLLLGVLVAVTAVGVITAYPGFVAACFLLRSPDSFSFKGYVVSLRQVVQSGVAGLAVPPFVVGLVLVDAVAIRAGVPGSFILGVVVGVVAVGTMVLGLRVASRWRPGVRWGIVVRAAGRDFSADVRGSVVLAIAALAAVGVVVLVPMTLLLIGGMLALAAAAVGTRVEVGS